MNTKNDIVVELFECDLCFQVCQIFLVRPWWSSTAQSVWMCTTQSHHVTITRTAHTLVLVSHTCYSWCIQSTDPNDQLIASHQGSWNCINITFFLIISIYVRISIKPSLICCNVAFAKKLHGLSRFQTVWLQDPPSSLRIAISGSCQLQESTNARHELQQ